MASSSELSLDCKPQSYSMLLKSFGDNFQSDQTTQKLEDLLSRLEQERLKIDAFKRELPLCMQLLNNGTVHISTCKYLHLHRYSFVQYELETLKTFPLSLINYLK